MQKTYSRSETCSIYSPCTGRELYNSAPWQEKGKRPEPFKPIDAKGLNGCEWCRKPYRENMMKCPDCGRYYFGPIRNGYPRKLKLEIECEACE